MLGILGKDRSAGRQVFINLFNQNKDERKKVSKCDEINKQHKLDQAKARTRYQANQVNNQEPGKQSLSKRLGNNL